MTDWPESLPLALCEGYRETPPETSLRTAMDQGPAKTRQRTTAGVSTLSLNFILSTAQTALLDGFFTADTAGGSLAFGFTHPRTGGAVSCRFRQPPVYQALNGDYYRVGLELEVLP